MDIKKLRQELEYLYWLKTRIKDLRHSIKTRTEFDHSTDFAMLARKLKNYELDYFESAEEIIKFLKDEAYVKQDIDVQAKTDSIRQFLGAVSLQQAGEDRPQEEVQAEEDKTGGACD